ncbi:hypothetical protein MATL_G00067420 [Megalops atlanticus]|uniref:Uncharacterized protein n=1 Tax=Megalops atlanticus TaxID=7932 RepID=A0A9D3QDP1_MEGAT|nr:hypothetical protein MATL_G00067420 [Megalops atlanticus]
MLCCDKSGSQTGVRNSVFGSTVSLVTLAVRLETDLRHQQRGRLTVGIKEHLAAHLQEPIKSRNLIQ